MPVSTVRPKVDARLKIHQALGVVGIALERLRVEIGNLHTTDKHGVHLVKRHATDYREMRESWS
jgi:hypothetical protein